MDMRVDIESVDGNQMAAKITGRFAVGDETFPFTAIAFGRIGGQNVGAKLTKKTVQRLKALHYDADETLDTLQHNLVQGNIHLPKGLQKESFADG